MNDPRQQQTKDAFSYKWKRRDEYEGEYMRQKVYKWLVERYFGREEEKINFIETNKGKSLLDAGCGSCFSSLILFDVHINDFDYLGVDISDAIEVGKKRFQEKNIKGQFLQTDIQNMKLNKKFDIIFSEGVIHHTSRPFETFKNLVSHMEKDGMIMFYVYNKKAPVREFTDDYIREQLRGLNDEEAWNELLPLTKLGKLIGDLNIEIDVDEDIKLLKIPKGKHNLQRLLYWFFLKMYYDENFTIEEMNFTNFDWFRPLNCYRFTTEEIDEWIEETNLKKIRFVTEEAGITVVAKKV